MMISIFTLPVIAAVLSPVGRWKTIDDESGKVRSIVDITQHNGLLQGNIEKVYLQKGEHKTDVCKLCSGEQHNKPIWGMKIFWNMKKVGQNLWKDGTILDPHNGKTYRCELALGKDGKTLTVRGYIGLPIFGRSQTWIRIS